jgi:3-hydroxybutyryl-CoA dehydrogenase
MSKGVIGVVGSGTMGRGIAQSFLQAGHKVIITDKDSARIKSAGEYILKGIDKVVELGKISKEEGGIYKGNLVSSDSLISLCDAFAIIEAVNEDLALKQGLFCELDKMTKADTILASNTSTLSIEEIAAKTTNRQRVIGIHFFVPAEKMKLVEVIPGIDTGSEIISKTMDLLNGISKSPVLCKDTPGFIVNRLFLLFENEAARMFDEKVASKEDIDNAIKLGLNHKMGPLELADLVGLDVIFHALTSLFEATKDPKFKPAAILAELVNRNELGQKTGKGFYKY